jgi:hypothetical protein
MRPVFSSYCQAVKIILIHLGGETREVEVTGIWQNKVTIRWGPLSGLYSLNIKKNILQGTRGQWRAQDIEVVKEYYRKRRAEQDAWKT